LPAGAPRHLRRRGYPAAAIRYLVSMLACGGPTPCGESVSQQAQQQPSGSALTHHISDDHISDDHISEDPPSHGCSGSTVSGRGEYLRWLGTW
jgi:hypothetical protein